MTYSIVAVDRTTGLMGVAVQSHYFSTGSVVPWARPGTGVVATQAMVNAGYGPRGLACMRAGLSPESAMRALLSEDAEREVRQVAFADATGNVFAHTGKLCIAEAGHCVGKGYSCQANMMERDTVWGAMAEAYEQSEGEQSLDRRLLSALYAAQAEGGDIRGVQSGAIKVCRTTASSAPWNDMLVDVRVDDSPDPLGELSRLLDVRDAYAHVDRGDEHISRGEIDDALDAYSAACELSPENDELRFWNAVTLAQTGDMDSARCVLEEIISRDRRWGVLLSRLPAAQILDAELAQDLLKK